MKDLCRSVIVAFIVCAQVQGTAAQATEIDLPGPVKLLCWTAALNSCTDGCHSDYADCLGPDGVEDLQDAEDRLDHCEYLCDVGYPLGSPSHITCNNTCQTAYQFDLYTIPNFLECTDDLADCGTGCLRRHCSVVPDGTPSSPVGGATGVH